MQSERERLPDLRQSVTKKIVIRHTHEDIEKSLDQAQEKLDRVRALVTAPAKKDPGEDCTDANSATLEAVRRVVDEPVKVTPTITDDVKIYAQVGLYPDGRPGEIFLKADRMGSTLSGMLDALSMAVSVALQAGVPLEWFTAKLKNLQFEPSGPCTDPQIRYATSIVDGLAKWLEHRFAEVVTEKSESQQ